MLPYSIVYWIFITSIISSLCLLAIPILGFSTSILCLLFKLSTTPIINNLYIPYSAPLLCHSYVPTTPLHLGTKDTKTWTIHLLYSIVLVSNYIKRGLLEQQALIVNVDRGLYKILTTCPFISHHLTTSLPLSTKWNWQYLT